LPDIYDERLRIARDLHDGIAQDLAALGYTLDAAIGRSSTSEETRSDLRRIRQEMTRINLLVRNEILELRSINKLDYTGQLNELLSKMFRHFTIVGELPAGDIGGELIKVLRELSLNAKNHAHASRLQIEISSLNIVMTYDGDDHGEADVDATDTNNVRGFGVIGIRERLAIHGAEIVLDFPTRRVVITFTSSC